MRSKAKYAPMRHVVPVFDTKRGEWRDALLPDYLPADDDRCADTYQGVQDCSERMRSGRSFRLLEGLAMVEREGRGTA